MTQNVEVIGAPLGHGGKAKGCRLGPDAIRLAGLADHVTGTPHETRYFDEYIDGGNIDLGPDAFREYADKQDIERLLPGETKSAIVNRMDGYAKGIDTIAHAWDRIADRVAESVGKGHVPLVIGGDHTIATGTMRGASRDTEIGVLWLDAHGDFNTPASSPSGDVHGMPLGAALGRGGFDSREWAEAPNVREENVAMVGLRELDHSIRDGFDVETEAQAIANSDAHVHTMSEVSRRGLVPVVEQALDEATDGVDAIHVSVDLDWLDSSEVPGVYTDVEGGATRREARSAMELVAERHAETDILQSVEFVEVNPVLDHGNRTAEVAAELAGATFGETFI